MAASDQKATKPPRSDHDKYVYFRPGELIFVVTHPDVALNENDPTALADWSNKVATNDSERSFKLKVLPRKTDAVISFPAFPNPESGIPAGVPQYQEPSSPNNRYRPPRIENFERHSPFTIILADVKDSEDSNLYVDGDRLASFIVQLDKSIPLKESQTELGLTPGTVLEIVSPNWLSSPNSETGTGGGPGSRPAPFTGGKPPEKSQHEFRFATEKLATDMAKLLSPLEHERGKGVIVAILDTAPGMHDLVAAYERWQKVDPQPNLPEAYPGNPPQPHGLIETLLKPGGPLTVHYASYEEHVRMRSVHLKDHNYNMTNHGLFVAGIIHSIAPAAEIHLYEVLNPEGVGDLKSLADGLSKVSNAFPGKQLVVNCSLVLNIPLLNHPIIDLPKELKARFVHEWDKHKDKHETLSRLTRDLWSEDGSLSEIARQARAIERICNSIYEGRSRVIAAAGNDWEPGSGRPKRPQARYPAAFDSVAGVGALKRRHRQDDLYDPAEYSDQSDRPTVAGIMTFGGEKGPEKGVLGIYLGTFPPPDENGSQPAPNNESDWAWWAGTSFATPIISGITAAVLSNHPGWTTEQAIKALYDVQAFSTSPEDEDVLDVTQGTPPV
jgi:hypothetical protein